MASTPDKLQRGWVHALGEVISGIVWGDKLQLWLVDGIQANH